MSLLGLDVGTTGVKAAVFDPDGRAKGYGFQEYPVLCEKPGLAEQDPETVWHFAKLAVRQAIAGGAKDIEALSLSVQGDAVIPVDKNLMPLHHALLGMDYRSKKQSDDCIRLLGERALFDRTGMRPHPMNSLTKMLWFRENMPGIADRLYKFMTYADYMMAKLGAEPVIDFTMASRTMAFELAGMEWSGTILDKVGLEAEFLSRAVPSGEIVGKIRPALAEELGLPKTVLLASGGHDQTCAALGAGVVDENAALDSHGTAEVLSAAFRAPRVDDGMYDAYYPCYCHARKERYFTFSLNHIGGILLQWYRDNLGHAEAEEARKRNVPVYGLMESKTSGGPSPVLVLPHFNGSGTPWCDLDSKGAFIGLTMSTTRHDLVKGIMDSLAYELRINLETMKRVGIRIDELRAAGGAARSPLWLQIKADVTGCRVATLKIREAACLGAAILAGTASGTYGSVDEGVEAAVKLGEIYEPEGESAKRYEEKYAVYKDLYGVLKMVNARL
jgi:xylulokinase